MLIQTTKTFGEYLGEARQYLDLAGWSINLQRGVYKQGADNKVLIASTIPIFPSALLKNQENGTEKIELTFFKRNQWYSIIVDRNVTANKQKIITLANQGVEVNSTNANNLVNYLADVIANSITTLPYKLSRTMMGWNSDLTSFAPYEKNLVFDGEKDFGELFNSLCSNCSLQEWVEFVKPLRENFDLRMMMAASFASPLIEIIGENPFVFLLYGKTGTAKTVALLTAMSIWGNPALGRLVRTMNMTNNAMLSQSAFLKNLPFAGDELQTIKSRWANYDQLIMQITEGVDRGRMTFDKLNETRSWKCAYIFTGEEPCTKANSGGGVKNRCIELELQHSTVKNGNEVANFVKSHYGCAGEPYIRELLKIGKEQLVERYRTLFRYITEQTNTTDKQAGALALIVEADMIASNLFFQGETSLTRYTKLLECVKNEEEVDPSERAYDFILDTISRYSYNFEIGSRDRWGKTFGSETENYEVYFNKTVLEKILNDNGFDFGSLKKTWVEKGYIERNSQGKFIHQTSINGNKTNCILLKIKSREGNDNG